LLRSALVTGRGHRLRRTGDRPQWRLYFAESLPARGTCLPRRGC